MEDVITASRTMGVLITSSDAFDGHITALNNILLKTTSPDCPIDVNALTRLTREIARIISQAGKVGVVVRDPIEIALASLKVDTEQRYSLRLGLAGIVCLVDLWAWLGVKKCLKGPMDVVIEKLEAAGCSFDALEDEMADRRGWTDDSEADMVREQLEDLGRFIPEEVKEQDIAATKANLLEHFHSATFAKIWLFYKGLGAEPGWDRWKLDLAGATSYDIYGQWREQMAELNLALDGPHHDCEDLIGTESCSCSDCPDCREDMSEGTSWSDDDRDADAVEMKDER